MVRKIGIYQDPRNKGRPWVCRWFTVVDPETGKRKRFRKAFEFKRDAERFRSEKAVEFEQRRPTQSQPGKANAGWLSQGVSAAAEAGIETGVV